MAKRGDRSERDNAEAARALLAWFDREKRDLPWRRTTDPYAIWLSEVMLQQTRVETVIPYFERFFSRFPSVTALANAELPEVLGAWAGLGYYRRARGLHAAAKEVVARYRGSFPTTAVELATLPGVGRYTAGAVASIAFGERTPAVDGNVTRVVSRLLALSPDLGANAAGKRIEEALGGLIPEDRAGDFNQALMELGATVCSPTSPRCEACPVATSCKGRSVGLERVAGGPKPRAAVPTVRFLAAIAERRGAVLLGRRPLDGLFGGLWEPPLVEGTPKKASVAFARAGIEVELPRKAQSVVHVLTHRVFDVKLAPARAQSPGALAPYTELAWVKRADLPSTPMSALAQRLLRASLTTLVLVFLALAFPRAAAAQETQKEQFEREKLEKRLERNPGATVRLFFTAATGFGFRFNNPYRLEDQLGEDAASASMTSPYLDLALSVVAGPANWFQHGASVHIGSTLDGVAQPYLTPSYVLAYRADLPVLLYGRIATPLLLSPDFNVGAEIAGSVSYFFNSGIGLTSEIAFDLFYGAATLEEQYSTIPILSFQMGVIADYEFLP